MFLKINIVNLVCAHEEETFYYMNNKSTLKTDGSDKIHPNSDI